MESNDKLTERQEAFIAAYIGEAHFNATKAAEIAGYSIPRASGTETLQNPVVKRRINEHLEGIRSEGLGNKAVRVAALNSLYEDLRFVQEARARRAKQRIDDGEVIPEEAASGLIVETVKQAGKFETTEWALDKSWVDSGTKVLEQIAKEVGDRDKKIELTGANGGPLEVASAKSKFLDLIDEDA